MRLTPAEISQELRQDAVNLLFHGDDEAHEFRKKYGIIGTSITSLGLEVKLDFSHHSTLLKRSPSQIVISPYHIQKTERLAHLLPLAQDLMQFLPSWFFSASELILDGSSILHESIFNPEDPYQTEITDNSNKNEIFSESIDQVLAAREFFTEDCWNCPICDDGPCELNLIEESDKIWECDHHGLRLESKPGWPTFQYTQTSNLITPEILQEINNKYRIFLSALNKFIWSLPNESILMDKIPFGSLISISDTLNQDPNFFEFLSEANLCEEPIQNCEKSDQDGSEPTILLTDEPKVTFSESEKICHCQMQILLAQGCQCQNAKK